MLKVYLITMLVIYIIGFIAEFFRIPHKKPLESFCSLFFNLCFICWTIIILAKGLTI